MNVTHAAGLAPRLSVARLGWMSLVLCLAACEPADAPRERPAAGPPAQAAQPARAAQTGTALDSGQAVALRRAADTGYLALHMNEAALARLGDAVHVQVRVACKFVPARGEWQRLPASPTRIAYRMEPRPAEAADAPERVLYELPKEAGLFWVLWIEERERDGRKEPARERQELLSAGPSECSAPRERGARDSIAACVPGNPVAQWVPDPAVACAELK